MSSLVTCGVSVCIKKGDIITENVDGIVNLTNKTLDQKIGVSGAILAGAGSSVTEECKKLGSLPGDGIILTGGGNLKCKNIIHLVGPTNAADTVTSVEKILQVCEDNDLKTVAFPAIGTGQAAMDSDSSITSILDGIEKHLTTFTSSCLAEINIITFTENIHQAFLNVLKSRSTTSQINTSDIKICGTSVQLKIGDITDENVDAVVNLTNAKLNQTIGISGAILSAAGSSVKDECESFGTLPGDGIAVTGGGNLKCKNIIHVVAPTIVAKIVTSVEKVLQECENNSYTSVAFPAIGTGLAGIDAKSSIKSIFDGIENHLSKSNTSCVSEIYIITFTQNIYKEYFNAFHCRSTNPQITLCHLTICDKSVKLKKGDITQENVEGIVNLTNQTLDNTVGVSGAVFSAAGTSVKEECQRLGKLPDDGIAVTGGGNLKCKNIIHVIGPKKTTEIVSSVEKILQECDKNSLTTVAIPAIGTGKASIDPHSSISFILDGINSYLTKTTASCLQEICIIAFTDDIYQKYLDVFQTRSRHLQVVQQQTHNSIIIDIPSSWADMSPKDFMAVRLQEDCREFEKVAKNFHKTSRNKSIQVIKIERIQDEKQWQSYSIKKLSIDRKYPNQKNKHHLYHGTSFDATKKINRHGFNRSFCGKNATAYGNGTYFAKKAHYSCQDQYSVPDQDGQKYVYQAAVITGKYCAGKPGYKEPPHIDGDPNADLYGCVVDNVQRPSIFVVFCDDGAYPEYLITFKIPNPTP